MRNSYKQFAVYVVYSRITYSEEKMIALYILKIDTQHQREIMDQLDKAQELYEQTLEIERRILGPDHPDTIITLENLSGVHFTRGRPDLSAQILPEVLAARRRVLGEDHPAVTKTLFNMAMVAKARGETKDAIRGFEPHALHPRCRAAGFQREFELVLSLIHI